MVLTNDDCEFINDVDKGLIYFIQFKVTKTIQDSNYSYYEGICKNGSIERYISIKHNQNGFDGKWFKFTLDNGEYEYVKGPWPDFSRNFIK
jgi:hypothetical protein